MQKVISLPDLQVYNFANLYFCSIGYYYDNFNSESHPVPIKYFFGVQVRNRLDRFDRRIRLEEMEKFCEYRCLGGS